MSRPITPDQSVSITAWRLAILALCGVVASTALVTALIAARGAPPAPPQALLDHPEAWLIQSGSLDHGVLVLRPATNTPGVALHSIASLTFTLQSRLQIASTHTAAGLIFDAQAADHFSAFLISPDGYFMLGDYRAGVWRERAPWRAWPHIHRADQPNVLRAECNATGCAFFVNDEWTWHTSNRVAGSAIGLVADPLSTESKENTVRIERIDLWY